MIDKMRIRMLLRVPMYSRTWHEWCYRLNVSLQRWREAYVLPRTCER